LTCRPDQICAGAFARSVTKNKTVKRYKSVLVASGKPAVCPRLAGLSPGTICPRVMNNALANFIFFQHVWKYRRNKLKLYPSPEPILPPCAQRPVFMAAADLEARFCPRGRNEIKKRRRHWQRSPAADINTLLLAGRPSLVKSTPVALSCTTRATTRI